MYIYGGDQETRSVLNVAVICKNPLWTKRFILFTAFICSCLLCLWELISFTHIDMVNQANGKNLSAQDLAGTFFDKRLLKKLLQTILSVIKDENHHDRS